MAGSAYIPRMAEGNFNKSNVSGDVEINGSLTFKGQLSFEGKLRKGSITGEMLVLGQSSEVKGNILVDSLKMNGEVSGDITVNGKCELGNSAHLTGNLVTRGLSMADGATLIGQMQIGPDTEKLRPQG
jgi:cytoskeletal protein CcmA (bactofilin family)